MRVYSKDFKKALSCFDYKKLQCPIKLFDFVLLFAGVKTRINTYFFYSYYNSFDFHDKTYPLLGERNTTLEEYFKVGSCYVKHKSNVLLFWLTPNLLWYNPKVIYEVLDKKKNHWFLSLDDIRNRFENAVFIHNDKKSFSRQITICEKDFIDLNDPEILLLRSISSV